MQERTQLPKSTLEQNVHAHTGLGMLISRVLYHVFAPRFFMFCYPAFL